MTLLQDGMIALLAAVGAVTLLWLPACALLHRAEDLPVVLMVPLRGKAEQMEYIVRTLELRRSRSGSHAPIVLVDAGLELDALRRARLLTGDHPDVLLMSAAEVSKFWE
ncbi:MAG: hypothetical protein II069_06175 [Oscillospiraceae bacterium]|jgi:hypothetical protein|nr:hypothetical protein [Oscillospiraceae bacterium]MBQ2061978.1 hypothetical protein [Oscillospiraceae bacterium]